MVMPSFASSCGFPPSLSNDAQEAAACCTSALPPHTVPLPKGLWSRVWSSASDRPFTLSCQLCASTASLLEPVQEGYGPYPAMTAPGSEEIRFCGREGACVREALLLIMCTLGRVWSDGLSTGLDLETPRC